MGTNFNVSASPILVTELSNILVCLGANVLIDNRGIIKLTDFGIGKDLQVGIHEGTFYILSSYCFSLCTYPPFEMLFFLTLICPSSTRALFFSLGSCNIDWFYN